MKLKTKILLTILPTFLYLGIPKNYSSAINPTGPETETHLLIDKFNEENKKKNLEKIINLKEAEKVKEFNERVYEPIYLTKKEINKYIDSIYNLGVAPKEISKEIFKKIIYTESGYNINAFNKKTGARGLGQLLEIAWDETGEDSISYQNYVYNPQKNLTISLKYLKSIKNSLKSINPDFNNLDKKERLQQIIAAYNWGIGSLEKVNFDLNKIPKETKDYFKKLGLN